MHYLNVSAQVLGQWPNFDVAEAYRSARLAFLRRDSIEVSDQVLGIDIGHLQTALSTSVLDRKLC